MSGLYFIVRGVCRGCRREFTEGLPMSGVDNFSILALSLGSSSYLQRSPVENSYMRCVPRSLLTVTGV